MDQKTFSIVAGVIFAAVALFHLVRIYMDWPVMIADWSVPKWVSWVGLIVAGGLAILGFRFTANENDGNARLSFGAFLWPIRGLKSKKRAITRPMQLRLQKPLILLTQKGHSAATDQASSVLPIGGGAATRIAATIRSTTRKG